LVHFSRFGMLHQEKSGNPPSIIRINLNEFWSQRRLLCKLEPTSALPYISQVCWETNRRPFSLV
jgi:hypothetical protein